MNVGEPVEVPDAATLAEVAAHLIQSFRTEDLQARGRHTVALAGGSTPRATYERMAAAESSGLLAGAEGGAIGAAPRPWPWDGVEFYFGDERCVPPDHPESNYRLASEALFARAAIPPSHVHRMEGEAPDRDRAARRYEEMLPPVLDLLILGMGEDGHCASLFPGSPALREERRRVVPAESPSGVRWRLTITPPVIAAARRILMLVSGARKARAVARALEGPLDVESVPAQLARGGTWLLDRDAAADLRRR